MQHQSAVSLNNDTSFIKNADRIRFAINAAGIGVWEVDLVNNKVIWDDRCRALFGLHQEHVLPYEQAIKYIHPDDVAAVSRQVEAALRGENGGSYNAIYRTIGADDGKLRWVNFNGTAYFDKVGNVQRFGGIAQDFTDVMQREQAETARHKEMTSALKKSEGLFRSLIEEAPIATCLFVGREMIVELANQGMIEIWGKGSDVIGKPLEKILPELEDQHFLPLLQDLYTTGATYEAKGGRADLIIDGELRTYYFDYTFKPLRNEAGEVFAILEMAEDVTEEVLHQKKIEEVVALRTKELAEANSALQEMNKELQRSNQNLEEFAHAASHDLKEPIRKIQFFTNRLKDQLTQKLAPDQLHTFSRISNASERMGLLIDDLLLYSHVSHRPHEKEAVDLNEQLKQVIEDLELEIQQKAAVVDVQPLPVVEGHRRQLQQLFQNLISNALKYSRKI